MSAADVIAEAQSRGIELIPDGDLIRYRAPHGAMTPQLQGAIRANRAGVLRILAAQPIDPHDRSSWPDYLVRLERISRDQFGPEAAARQVRAELEFLRWARADGWHLQPDSRSGGAA